MKTLESNLVDLFKKPNKAVLLTILLFIFITLPIIIIFVTQRQQIADIRNQAAYPDQPCTVIGSKECTNGRLYECQNLKFKDIGPCCTEGYLSLGACCEEGKQSRTYRYANCTEELRCDYVNPSCTAPTPTGPTPTGVIDPNKCSIDSDPTCQDRSQCAACTIVDGGGGSSGGCEMSSVKATWSDNRYICTCVASCTIRGTNSPTPPQGATNTPVPPTNPPNSPLPTNTTAPTDAPRSTNTPTSRPTNTPIIGQCLNIKFYKNNVVVNPNTLMPGDNTVIAVVGTNATQARIKINNENTWRTSSQTNTLGEWIFTYSIPTNGTTSFSVIGELFIGGVWR